MFEKVFGASLPTWAKVLIVWAFIATQVGFAMFIFEEAMQATMFAAFIYQGAEDMEGMIQHLAVMRAVHAPASVFIRYVGWLHPLMYPAYLSWLRSFESYMHAMERRYERWRAWIEGKDRK